MYMRKKHTYLAVLLAGGLSSGHARAEPPAASSPGCSGLTTSQGNFSQSLGQHRANLQQRCGRGGDGVGTPYSGALDRVADKLKVCDSISPSKTIGANDHLRYIRERYKTACQAQKHYIENAGQICDRYGRRADAVRRQEQASPNCGAQATCLANVTKLFRETGAEYHQLDQSAQKLHQEMARGFNNATKQDGDKTTTQLMSSMRDQILNLTKILRQQAAQKLAQRQNTARDVDGGEGGAWGTALRWRTQADVNKFYQDLAKCESAAKDLQTLEPQYQQEIGKPTAGMADEASAARSFFAGEARDYANSASEAQTAERRLNPETAARAPMIEQRQRELAATGLTPTEQVQAGARVSQAYPDPAARASFLTSQGYTSDNVSFRGADGHTYDQYTAMHAGRPVRLLIRRQP
jgi:hypothetical protein